MKVISLLTYENVKCEEGLKKYYEFLEKDGPYFTERRKKFNVKLSSWGDGTGRMFWMDEFQSYEDYAKYVDDEEFQKRMIRFSRLVNNAEVKVLRESIMAPP